MVRDAKSVCTLLFYLCGAGAWCGPVALAKPPLFCGRVKLTFRGSWLWKERSGLCFSLAGVVVRGHSELVVSGLLWYEVLSVKATSCLQRRLAYIYCVGWAVLSTSEQ